MFSVKVTRKKMAKYPATFARINREFLPSAGAIVEGDAKLRAPVDLGTLRASIQTTVGNESVSVGTNVEYAPYQEYGTRKMRAQPFLRPALDNNRKKIVQLYREIFRRVFRGRQR